MRRLFRERPGVTLRIAGRGAEALEIALAERPVLILLDRHLPDLSGDEILELLRAREETAAIPVVFVSGDIATPAPGTGPLGVIGYLTKPFNVHELLSYIDQACAAQS